VQTESPLCTPVWRQRACERIGVWLTCLALQEDREATAEIFFETFNAPYLYIAVQAVLSLAAASCVQSGTLPALDTISGVAVESGDGVTSIVPVAYGYTIGSAVRTIPIAGKDVTKFIYQALRDRGEKVPADMAMYTAQHVKETYGYADLMRPAAVYHVDLPWLLCGQILRHERHGEGVQEVRQEAGHVLQEHHGDAPPNRAHREPGHWIRAVPGPGDVLQPGDLPPQVYQGHSPARGRGYLVVPH